MEIFQQIACSRRLTGSINIVGLRKCKCRSGQFDVFSLYNLGLMLKKQKNLYHYFYRVTKAIGKSQQNTRLSRRVIAIEHSRSQQNTRLSRRVIAIEIVVQNAPWSRYWDPILQKCCPQKSAILDLSILFKTSYPVSFQ